MKERIIYLSEDRIDAIIDELNRIQRLERELDLGDTADFLLIEQKMLWDELMEEVEKDDSERLAEAREQLKNLQ